jgi:peptidoglycan hydrolase CwlO-like protein
MILTVLTTATLIFGLNISEFISLLGLLITLIGGALWVRVKLAELDVKIKDIDVRMEKNEKEIEKVTDKLDNKIDKIDEKIDNIIKSTNEIKVQCARNCKFPEILQNKV